MAKGQGKKKAGRKPGQPNRYSTLTPQEKQALTLIFKEGKSLGAASEAVYGFRNTLTSKLNPNAPAGRGSTFRREFERLIDKVGLTDKALLGVVRDGIAAKRVSWNAATQSFVEQELPDHPIRLHAAKMALHLKNRFPDKESRGPLVSVHIETNLSDPQVETGEFAQAGGLTIEAEAETH